MSALGRLEPRGEILDVGAPAGSRISRLGKDTEVGKWVTEGTPLAYLDSHDEMEAALKMAVSRMLHRYGELLRAEIANTVSGPEEVEEELRALLAAVSG